MKIYIPYPKAGIGGGHRFVENFKKALPGENEITHIREEDWDVLFVANPMHAERIDFAVANARGARIILRTDNIPEDQHNRGTAIPKLKDYLPEADTIIYQSNWAEGIYDRFIRHNKIKIKGKTTVINNGVDTGIFSPSGDRFNFKEELVVLHIKSSRTENKRFPEVVEAFRHIHDMNPNSILLLVGQFARETIQYNFGFYNFENYKYYGPVMSAQTIASLMRSASILLYPSFGDACSNTIVEAQSCHLPVLYSDYGGSGELIHHGLPINIHTVDEQIYHLGRERLQKFSDYMPFTIQEMVNKYLEVF